jgi:predicted site-specific integrase-resolvase
MSAIENTNNGSPSHLAVISLQKWMEDVGVTACTVWRWRKKGWLTTVNIAGRQYLTQEEIEVFHRRAVAGEFAQYHKSPMRKEVTP